MRSEQPRAAQSKPEQPRAEQPRATQSSPERPRADQSSLEQPRAAQSRPEPPRAAQSSPEQPRTAQSSLEQPRAVPLAGLPLALPPVPLHVLTARWAHTHTNRTGRPQPEVHETRGRPTTQTEGAYKYSAFYQNLCKHLMKVGGEGEA